METEIELKYLVNEDDVESKIHSLLSTNEISYSSDKKHLNNCYFDTADLKLRAADIGLRIRRFDDGAEQTIKTSGKVTGGLHQRPEYNTDIEGNLPKLSRFPDEIWPESIDFNQVQSNLVSLFTTDFERTIWLLTFDNGDQIEMALDIGKISAGGEFDSIREIELELKKGATQRLLEIAYLLTSALSLRPGTKSKAARGYAMANGNHQGEDELSRAMLVPLKPDFSIGRSCTTGLSYVIDNIQQTVDRYLAEPSLPLLTRLTDYLALIRHGLWLYKHYLPQELVKRVQEHLKWCLHQLTWVEPAKQVNELMEKSGYFRKHLEISPSLVTELKLKRKNIPDLDELRSLFYSERFNALQLDLLQLLLLENQLDSGDDDEFSLDTLATSCLDKSLANLTDAMPQQYTISAEVYLEQHQLLIRSLLTGFWFGGLYEQEARDEFRRPWFDLKQGIDELETLWFLKSQIALLNSNSEQELNEDDQAEKLASWVSSKIDTLLAAMEQSRQFGLKLEPYWRD